MSSYLVLARKYRPKNFSEVVGQDVVVKILVGAFKAARVSHSFLLTGIHGVGKTTLARLIAKSLNCTNFTDSMEPCGHCEQCVLCSNGAHPDIIEIDAASNTGVDDIRRIIDNSRYLPIRGQYKVYIIDEIHMLSINAFNSVLKTLEEPSDHVKFIFATTEISKLPMTVVSRCQRLSLRRLSVSELLNHLIDIVKMEGIDIDNDVLRFVAMNSNGSVRDSLYMMDYIVAYATSISQKPTLQEIEGIFGIMDRSKIFILLEKMLLGEVKEALALLRKIYYEGDDLYIVFEYMMRLIHQLLCFTASNKSLESLELLDCERLFVEKHGYDLSVPILNRLWQVLLKGLNEVKSSPDAYIAFEVVLIRFCHASSLPTLNAVFGLVKKISEDDQKKKS